MATVLIAGGSGYIGKHLTDYLKSNGYNVLWLTRSLSKNESVKQYKWDYTTNYIDKEALTQADVIINLAGTSINGKRWNEGYKKQIQDSRVLSTQFLYECLKNTPNNIKTLIQASAVGYYGYEKQTEPHTENNPAGKDFLSITCKLWEEAAYPIQNLGIRLCVVRTGIVFNPGSKAFENMVTPIRYYFGAVIGSGQQYFPWVHINDLCAIYLKLISDNNTNGVYNAVAPNHITNQQLTHEIAKHFKRKILLPKVPGFAIKLLFGELANSLLYGNKISAEKIIATGFKFEVTSITDVYKTKQ